MGRRVPLPGSLKAGPFAVSAAVAAQMGKGRLRGRDLERPFRGVRRPTAGSAAPGDELLERCRSYAPLLRPGERFSHLTALSLYGLPMPLGVALPPLLDITAPAGAAQVRRAGVRSHRSSRGEVRTRRGLPVSTPVDLFLELANELPLPDLLALGDALVLARRLRSGGLQHPLVPLETLRREVERAKGRGCRTAREAAGLVREGVESPMETRLRLLILRAGLPEPVPGLPLHDRAGRLIGFGDLVWPELRLVVEYDGDQHRTDTRQYEHDIARTDRLREACYELLRVRSRGLLQEPDVTAQLINRAFHQAALRMPRMP